MYWQIFIYFIIFEASCQPSKGWNVISKQTRSDILQGQALFRGVKQLRRCLVMLKILKNLAFHLLKKDGQKTKRQMDKKKKDKKRKKKEKKKRKKEKKKKRKKEKKKKRKKEKKKK